MPKRYVEYLDRPVRVGKDEKQKKRLREAAGRFLDKFQGFNSRNNEPCRRAMLIIRLNQRHVTYEEAKAQADRVARESRM